MQPQQQIEYRATYADGDEEIIEVTARDINAGFTAALKASKRFNRWTGKRDELIKLEFWQIKS